MNKRSIMWKKWVDPFAVFDDELEKKKEELTDGEDLDSDKEVKSFKGLKVLNTSFGIVPVNDENISSNNFDFWVGHTNFNITEDVINVLNTIPGIEILDVFSRYRFRISIAKHHDFTFREVRKNIDNALCGNDESKERGVVTKLVQLQEKVSEYKHWAIMSLPNGVITSIVSNSDNDEKFLKQLNLYIQLRNSIHAIVLTSEDDKSTDTG